MICKQCRELAERAVHAFNPQERFHLLAASISMKNVIDAATHPHTEKDRMINNSVITKLLLSIPPQQRESILQGFQQQSGIRISSRDCPHTPLTVASQ